MEFTSRRDRPIRILLIDDNSDLIEPIAASLCAAGHHVRATTRGDDLNRLVDLLSPEVLILDLIMENIDSLKMIGALRQSHPNVKIIAISGNPHLLSLASKQGARHTLAKPFHLEQLALLVKVATQ